jgi:isocitrate/isopropylmalate dehydrogenase
MSRVIRLALIPGDGIGPEVVAEAEKVLDAVTAGSDVAFEKTRFSLGRRDTSRPAIRSPTATSRRSRAMTRSCSAPSAESPVMSV